MRRAVRIMVRLLAIVLVLSLLAGLAAIVTIRSDWFKAKVLERVIAEASKASGGKVSIGSFDYDWKTLAFTIRSFTIRGTEGEGEAPLLECDSVRVGLKILSLWEKQVDIASLAADRPKVNLIVYPDGHTNLPRPALARPERNTVEEILALAVKSFELRGGSVRVAGRHIPLDARGENLEARILFDASGPAYRGRITVQPLSIERSAKAPVAADVQVEAALSKSRVDVRRLSLRSGASWLEASGTVADLANPRADFDWKAHADIAGLRQPLGFSEPRRGQADLEGKATLESAGYALTARLRGRDIEVADRDLRIAGIAADGRISLNPRELVASGLEVRALGGRFRGDARLTAWRAFEARGRVDGMSLATPRKAISSAPLIPYGGDVSGPVEVKGEISGSAVRGLQVSARLDIAPLDGPNPVSGLADFSYDQKSGEIRLADSHIELPSSRVTAAGSVGTSLEVSVRTTDLEDFRPALGLIERAPEDLPAKLASGGSFEFAGTVSGALADPHIAGTLAATHFTVEGQALDSLRTGIEISAGHLRLAGLTLARGKMRLGGWAEAGLRKWAPADESKVSAALDLHGAELAELAAAAGVKSPATGVLDASVAIGGTLGAPEGTLKAVIEKPVIEGRAFDRAQGELRLTGNRVQLVSSKLELGAAALLATGSYQRAGKDWQSGVAEFNAHTERLTLSQFPNVERVRKGMNAQAGLRAAGAVRLEKGEPRLTRLDGGVRLDQISVEGKQVGNLGFEAKTSGNLLEVTAAGDVRGSKIGGGGKWRLEGDYPGEGQLDISPIDLRSLQDLALLFSGRSMSYPIDGTVEARARFSGPLRKPDEMTARIELPRLVIRSPDTHAPAPREKQDLSLRNAEPLVVELKGLRSATVKSAKLTGKETDLQVGGTVAFQEKSPWDLTLQGNVNMAVLRDFDPDIEVSGRAVLDGHIRGSLDAPQMSGTLRLTNVAANFAGVPAGIDQCNGVIRFQNDRANIERLTAQVGGGTLQLGGFIGYAAGDAVYRLQGEARDVRVRTEGASITVSSALTLSGTSQNSLLAGSLTVRKAAFTPKTDVGGLLAQYSKPIETPALPNPLLRNMQLDVHIDSAPGLMFQTSLTRDLQAEADLRLRGTAVKPSVLGRVSVYQGQIQFFGTDYLINRGDISFFNPVKIEPVLDLDLQTTARGVVVSINFTGTISKLNVSYRSDPPLQSNEIIALLAVGRAPGENPALASSQTGSGQGLFSTGANTLLGQAISAPVSERLQRFFGVSRLKIDPQLTDVTAVPQARLTLEQQISKDVTLTYITSLNKAQEQVVRVQWDLNRQWSLVATRDENGLFGVDFQYRKRIK